MPQLLLKAEKLILGYPDTTIGFGMFRTQPMGRKLALKGVSLELRQGENLALIGSNGSGKSTLLRTLAGIYPPDAGTINTFGNSIQTLFNMGIGMKPELTGRQNITLMSMIGGKTPAEIEEMIPKIVEFSELHAVIEDPVRTYSRGMAMRLSFSVATALQPEILLLDEWIGAGDEYFRKKAQKRLTDMISGSKGFILASHNTGIVQQYCKRSLWLDNGEVIAVGPTEDVITEYIAKSGGRKSSLIRMQDPLSKELSSAQSQKAKNQPTFEKTTKNPSHKPGPVIIRRGAPKSAHTLSGGESGHERELGSVKNQSQSQKPKLGSTIKKTTKNPAQNVRPVIVRRGVPKKDKAAR